MRATPAHATIADGDAALTASVWASRVRPPVLPPQFIPRPRLSASLGRADHLPLVLVSAGAGSGKTVLLSDWVASRGEPTAWVSLDRSDDEPRRFWSIVAEALFRAGFVADNEIIGGLPYSSSGDVFAHALQDALGAPGQRTIVLDDAHVLTDPAIMEQLDSVIQYCSSQLQLVLGARSDPLLPLHRYRLAGKMFEIRADRLAMTKAESRALLTAHDVTLPPKLLDALTTRTEGWAAGVRLSAMSMANSRHPEQFVSLMSVDQGSIGEYLMEEVLVHQPAAVRQLMIQTSFLPAVNGELAAAVTGIDSSPARLDELSRSNSFVVPVDRDGHWYRYHHLIQEVLHYLLQREYANERSTLMSRAVSWYEKNGDTYAALQLAADAHDFTQVASILAHGGLANAFVNGQDLRVVDLDGVLRLGRDEPIIGDTVDVKIAQAAVTALQGGSETVEEELRELQAEALNPEAQVTAALGQIISAQPRGALADVDRAAAQLVKQLEGDTVCVDGDTLRAAVRREQASARFWSGHTGLEVATLLTEALESLPPGRSAMELKCLELLELSSAFNGRLAHAKEYATRSRTLLRTAPNLQSSATHYAAQAYAAFLRADFAGASRWLDRVDPTPASPILGDRLAGAFASLVRAWVFLSSGNAPDSYQFVRTDPTLSRELPDFLAGMKICTESEIETVLGRPNAALRVLEALDASGGAGSRRPALAAARALLAQGKPEEAHARLRSALIDVDVPGPLPFAVHTLLVAGQIALAQSDEAGAVEKVLRARELAGSEIVQPFVIAEKVLAPLIARHSELRQIWPSASEPSEMPAMAPPARLAEALTDREISVLRRLATTMTGSEIADELCVSINTVKTHIAAIYRKLPAAGRREAVQRARQLELL
jgi:LuxR family maltose regulon positive regulatory protein